MAVTNSPCAACKFLRRKCTQECVFAPYFPPDQPNKFACVHRVFGASNVAKILNDLHPTHREFAVNSLSYEAEMRLQDPVYGCVGLISNLQVKLKQLQGDLFACKKELSAYVGPALAMQSLVLHSHPQMMVPSGSGGLYGMGFQSGQSPQYAGVPPVREQHELMRTGYELQQQEDIIRYNASLGGEMDAMNAPLPIMNAVAFDNQFQLQQQPHPIQSLPQQTSAPDEAGSKMEPSC